MGAQCCRWRTWGPQEEEALEGEAVAAAATAVEEAVQAVVVPSCLNSQVQARSPRDLLAAGSGGTPQGQGRQGQGSSRLQPLPLVVGEEAAPAAVQQLHPSMALQEAAVVEEEEEAVLAQPPLQALPLVVALAGQVWA